MNNGMKRIIVLSSSMVFENTELYPTPETEVLNAPPPSSTYGFQKLASEYFAKGAWEQYKLPYTIVRPFNCVGVGEEKALGALVGAIMKASKGKADGKVITALLQAKRP